MSRHIALLRGINVGGRRVRMDRLRGLFEEMGFREVATFIASGNVIFHGDGEPAALEARIQEGLRRGLGYEVDTRLRTPAELAAVAAHEPFGPGQPAGGSTLSVLFLPAPLPAPVRQALAALETEMDRFHPHGRELYWWTAGRTSDSPAGPAIGRALGAAGAGGTLRNVTTVRRLSALHPA